MDLQVAPTGCGVFLKVPEIWWSAMSGYSASRVTWNCDGKHKMQRRGCPNRFSRNDQRAAPR